MWDVLADRDAYAENGTFILSSAGDLVVGRRIANVLKDGAGKVDVRARAAGGRAGTRGAGSGRSGSGGIFDGEHAFGSKAGRTGRGPSSRRRGSAVSRSPLAARLAERPIKPQFDAMNTALATRVQSR